ncbi:MAG: hypothetical protein FWG73_02960 [Planctomycetaceae bacterium]|nr:hypothetical protein [Planctomycetaceae bacterium]
MTHTFLDGCLPEDDFTRETVELLESSAVSFSTLYTAGDMPVLKWDDAFEQFLERRGNVLEDMLLDGCPLFPWREPRTNLYFSQGNTPSCMGHADDFAYRSSLLMSIGLGAPLRWDVTDPYQTWLLSKNGNTRGGQSVGVMANFANKYGHVIQGSKRASDQHQSAIVFLSGTGSVLADKIRRCNRAGLGVALGNSTAVNGTMVDRNEVQVAVLGGTWAHATSFNAWFKRNGQEYVFWTNSHGKRYVKATFGEPADGAWMRVDGELVSFLQTAPRYGMPYACLSEASFC